MYRSYSRYILHISLPANYYIKTDTDPILKGHLEFDNDW